MSLLITKRKILFCEAGVYGGSVNRLINLISNMNLDRFSPMIFTYYQNGKAKELLDISRSRDFPRVSMSVKEHPAPQVLRRFGCPSIFGLRYFWKSMKVLQSFQPDLIFLNNNPYCHLPMILSAKTFGIPIISYIRDSIRLTRSWLLAINHIDKIIVLSNTHKDFYKAQGVPDGKMVVIYNGIDLKQFDKFVQEPVELSFDNQEVIAFVGTLVSRKRQIDALRALELIVDDFPDINLLFLGDGPERENLTSMIKEKGLEKNAIIYGMVDNVAPYLRQSKIGLMLSDREGMPNVILEYMAAGIPVIATDLPGIREMITDGVTGYIVPVGDYRSVAMMIKRLLTNDNERKCIGNSARKVLEDGKFTRQSELKEIERLLIDVC